MLRLWSSSFRSVAADDAATRSLVAGVNYIFKSLDLIPDGVDDLGYMDDAFVIRVACALAIAERAEMKKGAIERLAEDARGGRAISWAPTMRVSRATSSGCARAAARGRTVEEIIDRPRGARDVFLNELREWSAAYQAPSFT